MDEKREFFRFEIPVPLRYKLEKDSSEGKGFVDNVSRSGIEFSADKKLAVGDAIKMDFEISEGPPVSAKGRVARVEKMAEANRFMVGVRFGDIAPADKAALLEFAYKQWLKSKKEE